MNHNNTPEEMLEVLRKAPKVALFSHVFPDGDCIGSMLALGLALEKMGKEVSFYNPHPVPGNLLFLPGSSRISQELPSHKPQVLLFVDCTDLERVNMSKADIGGDSMLLNIDHHVSNLFFGDYNWVDEQASAAGEVVMKIISKLGVDLDLDMATNLYTAILTDSGCFEYSNTTAQTHRLAAELLDKGVDLIRIHYNVYNQKPLAQVKLLACALNGLEIRSGGQLAGMILCAEDFQKSGADQEMSEGLVNHARDIAGVEAAVLLREVGPLEIKVSMRSNLWLNVDEIAARFGGGGHRRAAGCILRIPLTEAKQSIMNVIEEALRIGRDH